MPLYIKDVSRSIIFTVLLLPLSYRINLLLYSNVLVKEGSYFSFIYRDYLTNTNNCVFDVNYYIDWIAFMHFLINIFCIIKLMFSMYLFVIYNDIAATLPHDEEEFFNVLNYIIKQLFNTASFISNIMFYKSDVLRGVFTVCEERIIHGIETKFNIIFWCCILTYGYLSLTFYNYIIINTFNFIKKIIVKADFNLKIRFPKKKPNKIQAKNKCIICIDNAVEILLRPCNHICFCEECFKECRKNNINSSCPICRSKIVESEKIFYS